MDAFLRGSAPHFIILSNMLDPPLTSDGAYVAGLPLSGSVHAGSRRRALRADACLSLSRSVAVCGTPMCGTIQTPGATRERAASRDTAAQNNESCMR